MEGSHPLRLVKAEKHLRPKSKEGEETQESRTVVCSRGFSSLSGASTRAKVSNQVKARGSLRKQASMRTREFREQESAGERPHEEQNKYKHQRDWRPKEKQETQKPQ